MPHYREQSGILLKLPAESCQDNLRSVAPVRFSLSLLQGRGHISYPSKSHCHGMFGSVATLQCFFPPCMTSRRPGRRQQMKGQASLLSAVLTLACALPVSSQAPVAPRAAAHPGAASQLPPPSSLLQPTLGVVQKTLSTLSFDKWHRGTIRDEASSNVGSMLHDIQ